MHISHGIQMDKKTYNGDHDQHHCAKSVCEHAKINGKPGSYKPVHTNGKRTGRIYKINTIKGKQYANSKNYSGKFCANVSKPLTQQKSYYKTYKRQKWNKPYYLCQVLPFLISLKTLKISIMILYSN